MSEAIPNESEWAEHSAARLKAVWVDFAEAPPPQRAQFLKEELSRAINAIPSAHRGPYLDRLKMKFPVFAPAAAPLPSGPVPGQTVVETASCEDLIQALRTRIETMTPEEKAVLAYQLQPLLPFKKPDPVVVKVVEKVVERDTSHLPGPPSKDREALRVVLENYITLDNLGWRIWRSVAPRDTTVRSDRDLRAEAVQYLGGNAEILPQMRETLSKGRVVVGGLLAAVGGAPIRFANEFCGTFSPDNIMAEVGSREGNCWRKYADMARQEFPTPAALAFRIQRQIVMFAENAMKST
jgi:hypothetical protein